MQAAFLGNQSPRDRLAIVVCLFRAIGKFAEVEVSAIITRRVSEGSIPR